jgi:2'-5' RNA ligase
VKHLKNRSEFLSKEAINEVNVEDEDFGEDTKDGVKYEFGCIMLKVPLNEQWNSVLESIDEADVYEDEDQPGRFGIETDPHVTVLYGTHDNEIDLEDIKKTILDREGIELKMIDISIFENDDYDVLKFGVESEDLMEFNSELTEKYPYTNDYDYHPHATIAYLKPGTGKKYTKVFEEDEQIEMEDLTEITYSRVIDGEKEKIKMNLPLEESEDNEEENNESISDILANTPVPEEEGNGSIKKGDQVEVKMTLLKGAPLHTVTAANDSFIDENGVEMFSFLEMGDIMMIAKKTEDGWISE